MTEEDEEFERIERENKMREMLHKLKGFDLNRNQIEQVMRQLPEAAIKIMTQDVQK